MNFGQRADAERGRVRRNLLRHGSALAMGDRNEFRSTGRRGVGWTQGAAGFAAIYCGMGRRWRWATEMNFGQRAGAGRGRVRRNLFRHGSALAMGDRNEFRSTGRRGARKSSPKFIAARVGGGHGATEMNFGQRAGAERGRVRRNLFRHGSALAMGDRNEFRSTGRRGARKSSPQFIAARVGGGHGATEMNFGQRAGAGRGRVRRNLLRHGSALAMGDRNEFRSTGRRGARKSSPQFIAAWVGAGDGRPK
jgi:hypothetical protein